MHPDLSSVALDKPAWRRAPAGALLPLLLLLQLADKAIDCEKRDTQGWSAYQYVPHMMLVGLGACIALQCDES